MSSPTGLPPTMKAVIIDGPGQPFRIATIPTPAPLPGTCIVKILAADIEHNMLEIFSGHGPLTFPHGFTPGSRAVGRVVAPGPDATSLRAGQLVLLESFVRSRDDPDGTQILWGLSDGPTPASKRFMVDNWSGGCFAEYARAPLENVHALDEARLLDPAEKGGLGYALGQLLHVPTQLVALGGLNGMKVRPGERVIVAPATGNFSGAAIQAAVALGCQVVIVGRNKETLDVLAKGFPAGRVQAVAVTGDVEADAAAMKQWGDVDAYLDLSPFKARGSSHVRSCFLALRSRGRASLMGVLPDDVPVPYSLVMFKNLTIQGQYMYERADTKQAIKMAEAGVLRLDKQAGVEVVGEFGLDKVNEAFEEAGKYSGTGKIVALVP